MRQSRRAGLPLRPFSVMDRGAVVDTTGPYDAQGRVDDAPDISDYPDRQTMRTVVANSSPGSSEPTPRHSIRSSALMDQTISTTKAE